MEAWKKEPYLNLIYTSNVFYFTNFLKIRLKEKTKRVLKTRLVYLLQSMNFDNDDFI